jgi:hypothetical protein
MKTKKIRIAVVMNSRGLWNAVGSSDYTDDQAKGVAIDGQPYDDTGSPEHCMFVEVEIPYPENVQGKVDETSIKEVKNT